MNRKATLFALLLGISAMSLLLPVRYTGRLIGLVQVLAPFQDAAHRAADSIGAIATGPPEIGVGATAYQRLVQENATYRNTIAALSARLDALDRVNEELLGVRSLGLRSDGRLIPARVISDDAMSWRQSKLVDRGTLRGVREGSAVASDSFTADAGSEAGVRSGLDVLVGEALVGTVVQAATHTSRVRLLTDPQTRMAVVIGRLGSDGLKPLDGEFWLVGAGRAGLQVRDVDHRYVDTGAVREGDIVMSPGDDPALPVAAVVGKVARVRRDADNGLLYVLDVEPAVNADRLRRVYIVDAGSPGPAS